MASEKQRQYQREYYQKTKEKKKAQRMARYDKVRENQRKRYQKRRDEGWKRPYSEKNRARNRAYYHKKRDDKDFIEKRKVYKRGWVENNQDKIRASARARAKKPEVKEKKNERCRERYRLDTEYRLQRILRSRLTQALDDKRAFKWDTAFDLLGCSIDELMAHIQKQWKPGMSWDNYSREGWHIDHIIPCAAFDLTKPEEQCKCFHWSNLQPLWAKENLSKSDRVLLSSERDDLPSPNSS